MFFKLTSKYIQPHGLVALMTSLQLVWILAIWLTGASNNSQKLVFLAGYTLIFGVLVILTPIKYFGAFFPKPSPQKFSQSQLLKYLLLCGLILAVAVVYAAQQRVWPFDEENVIAIAQVIADKGVGALFVDYVERPWLGVQHPPLMLIIYGLGMAMFGTSIMTARLITLVFAVGTVILVYLIGKQLFSRESGLLAVLFLCSFPLFMRLGTVSMVEVPVTFFFTLAIFLTLQLVEKPRLWLLALLGLCLGAGFLVKYTLVFVVPVIFFYFVILSSFKQAVKWFAALMVLPALIFVGWILIANYLDILQNQINTLSYYAELVLGNSHAYGRNLLFETMTTRLPSAVGVYNLPLIFLGILFLGYRRGKADFLVLIWIGLVTIPLMLTLPDHRYFMLTFPALAIMLAETLTQTLDLYFEKIIFLALVYCGGTLYLFVDWFRAAHIFDLTPPP